jgi:hypothetical protein
MDEEEEKELLEDGFHVIDDIDADMDPLEGLTPEDDGDYDPDSRFT